MKIRMIMTATGIKILSRLPGSMDGPEERGRLRLAEPPVRELPLDGAWEAPDLEE